MSTKAMVDAINALNLSNGDKVVVTFKVLPVAQGPGGRPEWLGVQGVFRGLFVHERPDGTVDAALRYDETTKDTGESIKRVVDVDMFLSVAAVGGVSLASVR